MNEREKSTLQSFHTKLIDNIVLNETFFGEFIQAGILDFDLKEEILAERNKSAQIAKFLSILPRRGPRAFPILLQVLNRTSPWIQEDIESHYNKQKRFTGDVSDIFAEAPEPAERQELSGHDSSTFLDNASQTDSGVWLSQAEIETLSNAYTLLVSYLQSQGCKEYGMTMDGVQAYLFLKVVREVLNNVSMNLEKLNQIDNHFGNTEKEKADNDVHRMVANLCEENLSLKAYRDQKDIEVMNMEQEHNECIQNLECQLKLLEEVTAEKDTSMDALNREIELKSEEIQHMKYEETKRLQEPLLQRLHKLTEELTAAQNEKEEKMQRTEQEYLELTQEIQHLDMLKHLLTSACQHPQSSGSSNSQYKTDHDGHVFPSYKTAVQQSVNYNQHRQGYINNGAQNSANVGLQLSIGGSNKRNPPWNSHEPRTPSPKGPKFLRRRTKRPQIPSNRLNRSSCENIPMSPKQKTPRYYQPITMTQGEGRGRLMSRQGTDMSIGNASDLSRQSTTFLIGTSRQNSTFNSRPASKQSLSLDHQFAKQRNGSGKSNSSGGRSPFPSARQTPSRTSKLQQTYGLANTKNYYNPRF